MDGAQTVKTRTSGASSSSQGYGLPGTESKSLSRTVWKAVYGVSDSAHAGLCLLADFCNATPSHNQQAALCTVGAQTLFLAAKESHVSNWLLITLQLVNFLQLTTFSVTALAAAAAEVGTGARLRAEAAPMAR